MKFTRQIIDYGRTNWSEFFEVLDSNKPQQFAKKKFERKFKKFDKAIRRAFNKAVIVKEKKYYDSMPWLTEELEEKQVQIMNKRRRLSRPKDEISRRWASEELREPRVCQADPSQQKRVLQQAKQRSDEPGPVLESLRQQ